MKDYVYLKTRRSTFTWQIKYYLIILLFLIAVILVAFNIMKYYREKAKRSYIGSSNKEVDIPPLPKENWDYIKILNHSDFDKITERHYIPNPPKKSRLECFTHSKNTALLVKEFLKAESIESSLQKVDIGYRIVFHNLPKDISHLNEKDMVCKKRN